MARAGRGVVFPPLASGSPPHYEYWTLSTPYGLHWSRYSADGNYSLRRTAEFQLTSVADPICLSRIPDPHPHQRIYVFLNQQTVSKLSEKLSGMFIPDPDFSPIPDPDSGVKKALNHGSGSATLRHTVVRGEEIVTYVTGKLCRTFGHKRAKCQSCILSTMPRGDIIIVRANTCYLCLF